MGKKVLLLEDDELIIFLHRRYVEKCGCQVVGATCDYDEFHALFNEQKPDVIISDIFLQQDIDGIDFIMSLPDHEARVIYVTASSDPRTMEKAKTTKHHSLMVKPISLDILKDALNF